MVFNKGCYGFYINKNKKGLKKIATSELIILGKLLYWMEKNVLIKNNLKYFAENVGCWGNEINNKKL